MTAVFRSCLPRFYSNTNQSISSEYLSHKTNSIISLNDENSMDSSPLITDENIIPQLDSSSDYELLNNETIEQKPNLLSSRQSTKISRLKKNTKKRGPCYSRINEKSQPLLTRLVGTIFGNQEFIDSNNNQNQVLSNKKQRSKRTTRASKKSILPSKSTLKNQFEENEQTLRSLVTLLTQIESNAKLTTAQTPTTAITSDENHHNNLPIEKEQARNNNRMDDTSSSHSNNTYQHKSKAKSNYQHSSASKRCTNNRSTKKHHNNKRKQSEDDTLSSSSMTSHYLSQSSPSIRRKMIDNQQQTQIYPTKINMGTSTQSNDTITSEPSWLDVMREDQTTINAWARIRRRLKPNQQKDILRALMIICANLFEVPIENKHI